MIKIVIKILLVLFVSSIFSQNPVYKKYDSKNGLFSLSVNCIAQDSRGVIWIGTKNGISKFNGSEFTNFTMADGLPENNIIDFYRDNYGVVWFISKSKKIGYLKNDSIFNYKFNSVIKNKIFYNSSYVKNSLKVYNNTVKFAFNQIGIYTIDNIGFLKQFYAKEVVNGNVIVAKQRRNSYIINTPIKTKKLLFSNKIIHNKIEFEFSEKRSINQTCAASFNNITFIVDYSTLIILNKQEIIETKLHKSEIISLNIFKNELWVSTTNNGLFIYTIENNTIKLYSNIFNEYKINYIFKDNDNGYWFSTLNNGILYSPNINRVSLKINIEGNNTTITDMLFFKNDIYIAYSNGIIENVTANKFIKIGGEISSVNEIKLSDNKGSLYALINNKIFLINNNSAKLIINFNSLELGLSCKFNNLSVGNNNEIWVYSSNVYVKIINDTIKTVNVIDKENYSEITDIYTTRDGLYVSTNAGLNCLLNDSIINCNLKDSIFNTDIVEISSDSLGNNILFSTNGKGLIIVNNDSVYHLNEENSNVNSIINSACMLDSFLITGTNNGLNFYKINSDYNISHYNSYNGMFNTISRAINKLIIVDRYVYFITKYRLYKFPVYSDFQNNKPNINIYNIKVKNKDTLFATINPELKPCEDNISFSFTGISYTNIYNIRYRYKLKGEKDNWEYTNNKTVNFSYLPGGEYEFIVEASNNNIDWGEPSVFSFSIRNRLYKQWWVITIAIILFFLLLSVAIKLFYFRMRRSEIMQKDMLMYKQQALRKQLNPHFIFNSLNSIQHFILQNDKKMSNKYLNRFSNLMRIVLDNSQKNVISFDDELSAVKIYLEIETLRFKNKFTYEIDISDEIDTVNCKIPPLLLQPFLENSIWHGLMNLNDNSLGLLVFKMKLLKDEIICTIEDNGVGRFKANKIKQESNIETNSISGIINTKRVELFNYENNKKITMRYIDKYNSENKSTGTMVEIRIPVIY